MSVIHTKTTELLSRLIKSPIISIDRIGKGGNSKVYRVTAANDVDYAAKFYFQRTADGLDRMNIEFSCLTFLWENGLRSIPRPLIADTDEQIAIYEYISGSEIGPADVTEKDIGAVVTFLDRLRTLAARDGSANFPPASEACFSIEALIANIRSRLLLLEKLPLNGPSYEELGHFLREEFVPVLEMVADWAKSKIGNNFSAVLPAEFRTLSPSDYGFHNAVRQQNGEIVFVDFEYFGWDDPAKMISDFLLHPSPSMALGDDLKRLYVEAILKSFRSDEGLRKRLETVYPLLGLKWCTILLNEFIPENLQRRNFAADSEVETNKVHKLQLAKAHKMLKNVLKKQHQFPY